MIFDDNSRERTTSSSFDKRIVFNYQDGSTFTIITVPKKEQLILKCECGTDKVGGGIHSGWCPKGKNNG